MDFEKVLRMRRSTRSYTDQQVTESDIEKLIRAAQSAPLASGDHETTHLTVVCDQALMSEVRAACQRKSARTGLTSDALYGAQTIIFVSVTDISEDNIEYCNVACIIENIHLQATALGLGSVYIWGCLKKLRENTEVLAKLGLPDGYELYSAIAVGYPTEPLVEREPSNRIGLNVI
ncbi:MAG: nitroreductase family protein [Coriobacteriia bacterium]|nr:nitroreductase family protein [Coriobacteriia bacterium]